MLNSHTHPVAAISDNTDLWFTPTGNSKIYLSKPLLSFSDLYLVALREPKCSAEWVKGDSLDNLVIKMGQSFIIISLHEGWKIRINVPVQGFTPRYFIGQKKEQVTLLDYL